METKSNETLLNIIKPVSIIDNPNSFESALRDYDCTDHIMIASAIKRYRLNTNIVVEEDELYDPSKNEISPYESLLESESINETKVDILYNHFIDNVASNIPQTISPKYFYLISVYAAAFRKIKKEKSGSMKEMAALGLYQAEAILSLLYKKWFKCNKYYRNIGTGIFVSDVRRVAQELKTKAYSASVILNYSYYVGIIERNEAKSFLISSLNNIWDVIDKVNSCDEKLNFTKDLFDSFVEDKFSNFGPYIKDSNSEEYDKYVELINEGKISLLDFVFSTDTNSKMYNHKYLHMILESEYEQKSIDALG